MLKKFLKLMMAFGMMLILFSPIISNAMEATDTYTLSVDGEWIRTQTAYESVAILAHDSISRPEDLFIDAFDFIYVADSDHAHIAIFNHQREFVRTVGSGYLTNPTGVFVTDYIFVADMDYVFQFTQAGVLMNQFGRPDSPLFGVRQHFRPRKLAVDVRGNIYVIGEAANNGIIQLNASGEFLGYFGANRTTLTFFQTLQNLLLGGGNFTILPAAPTNIAIADNGIVLTVTANLDSERIRMLNIAGNNMIDNIPVAMRDAVDITIGNQGNFYVLYASGVIDEFDSSGNLLFSFGGQDPAMQRFGILRNPTSIEVASNGSLYVADAEAGVIHVFAPTEFTNTVHHALTYFEEGLYTQSEAYWMEVLRLNASFGLAHQAIGQSQFIRGYYEVALARFTLANNIDGYSESFWEIRHAWLMENMGFVIAFFMVYVVVRRILNFFDKKDGKISGLKKRINKTFSSQFFVEVAMVRKIFKKPFDVYYEIKRKKKATPHFATFLYLLIFIAIFITLYFPGFVFATTVAKELGFLLLVLIIGGAFGLFLIVNYLISTINDGEGSFKDVYIATAYSLTPFVLISIPTTILSHFLTLNEGFVYTALMMLAIGWSFLLIILMIKEIHDFSLRNTFKNLIMTVAGATIIVAITFILYIVIFDQMFEFVYSIIWEVLVRV